MKHLCIVLICLILFDSSLLGQTHIPILERKISITASNEKISSVLNRIGQVGGFSFSYNSVIISQEETVSLNITDKSVREVLNEIFKGTMSFKEKNNYLIITKAATPPIKNDIVAIVLNGYVEDGKTGEKITQASVYEKSSVTSTTTDQYGYFQLKLDKKSDSILISVNKKNYRDTLVSITASDNQYFKISMLPVLDSVLITARAEPVDTTIIDTNDHLFPYEDEPNVQNIHDTLYQLVQVSILPFIGTNERLSGNVINDYSINFLGGYSLGTRQIELGFFVNMDRGDVSWLQVAGFGNLVGGNVYGIQAAGFANVNGGETKAVQLAGFANTNLGESRGVQVAGFANTNLKSMNGVQVAGLSNVTIGNSRGAQIAGLGNVQIGDYRGSQIAGLTNIATEKISGSQISVLFNHGRRVQGTQIGLINYADTLGGVPIGLLSIVKSGYHKIELSADEVFYANLAFRTGVRKFHTMLMAGFKPQQSLNPSDTSVWTFGYGLGTARKLTRWLYLDLDLSSQHVSRGSFTNALSLLNKAYIGLDFQVAKKFSIATGISLNGYMTRTTYSEYPELFTDYTPRIIYNENLNHDINLKMWWGAKVALRFL
jgi:hypothetical protein